MKKLFKITLIVIGFILFFIVGFYFFIIHSDFLKNQVEQNVNKNDIPIHLQLDNLKIKQSFGVLSSKKIQFLTKTGQKQILEINNFKLTFLKHSVLTLFDLISKNINIKNIKISHGKINLDDDTIKQFISYFNKKQKEEKKPEKPLHFVCNSSHLSDIDVNLKYQNIKLNLTGTAIDFHANIDEINKENHINFDFNCKNSSINFGHGLINISNIMVSAELKNNIFLLHHLIIQGEGFLITFVIFPDNNSRLDFKIESQTFNKMFGVNGLLSGYVTFAYPQLNHDNLDVKNIDIYLFELNYLSFYMKDLIIHGNLSVLKNFIASRFEFEIQKLDRLSNSVVLLKHAKAKQFKIIQKGVNFQFILKNLQSEQIGIYKSEDKKYKYLINNVNLSLNLHNNLFKINLNKFICTSPELSFIANGKAAYSPGFLKKRSFLFSIKFNQFNTDLFKPYKINNCTFLLSGDFFILNQSFIKNVNCNIENNDKIIQKNVSKKIPIVELGKFVN